MSKYETVPVDFATIEPTREFVENGQRIVRIIDENDLKEPMDLSVPKKKSNFVSLKEDNPDFLNDYDYELNFPLTPNNLSQGTDTRVWWTIEYKDNELNTIFFISWKDSVNHRRRGRNCPYIRGLRIHPLFNSLQVKYPHIAEQWHPTLNKDLKPTQVSCHSDKEIEWQVFHYDEQLDKTFEFVWSTAIKNRVKANGQDNPYLSNKKILAEFNSLQARFKEIADEWHPTKNKGLKPTEVAPGSSRNVFWKCKKCGYVYSAHISDRTRKDKPSSCPKCNKSKFQLYVESLLKHNKIDFTTEVKLLDNYRYDIYSEINNLLYETDGEHHWKRVPHFEKKNTFEDVIRWDNDKNIFAFDQRIPLLRVPYLDTKWMKNKKKIDSWVLFFINTRQIPEEIIQFYEEKNPLSNYPEIARIMNTWINEQKATSKVLGIAESQ